MHREQRSCWQKLLKGHASQCNFSLYLVLSCFWLLLEQQALDDICHFFEWLSNFDKTWKGTIARCAFWWKLVPGMVPMKVKHVFKQHGGYMLTAKHNLIGSTARCGNYFITQVPLPETSDEPGAIFIWHWAFRHLENVPAPNDAVDMWRVEKNYDPPCILRSVPHPLAYHYNYSVTCLDAM